MPGRPWTKVERDLLEWEWTTVDVATLAKKLGRTPGAVREKARIMGLGSVKRGTYSLAEMAQNTGYDRGRILTAARRAKIQIPRAPRTRNSRRGSKGRHYAITHEAMERILEELARHPDGARLWRTHAREWGGYFRDGSKKPDACVGCSRTKKPHYTRGLCRACYAQRLKSRHEADRSME